MVFVTFRLCCKFFLGLETLRGPQEQTAWDGPILDFDSYRLFFGFYQVFAVFYMVFVTFRLCYKLFLVYKQ